MRRLDSLLALVIACVAASTAGAQAPAPVRIDPAWLRFDSATSSVEFTLVAGLGGTNGGMNFNGATAGALTLVVPVGWHVVLRFRNDDQYMPHSAEVIRAAGPMPVGAATPAFARAATRQLEQGLSSGSHEEVRFVADQAGAYMIFCAVPGHGAAGMWMRLSVSATASRPRLEAWRSGP